MNREDTQPVPVALSVDDCDLLVTEIQDVHESHAARTAAQRAHLYTAIERPGGDAMGVMTDAAYAAGAIYRVESRLDAIVLRNVHRSAGYTAEILTESRDLYDDDELDEEPTLAQYVVSSRTPSWTTAIQEA